MSKEELYANSNALTANPEGISQSELESFILEVYAQFYKDNEALFKENPILYWHEASRYKERKIQDYIYYGKKSLKTKIEPIAATPETTI